MASHRTGGTQPSAPPAPDTEQPRVGYPYQPPPSGLSSPYAPVAHTHSSGAGGSFGPDPTRPPQGYGYYPYPPPPQHHVYSSFPPGTHPDVVRSFQMVDRNQNGYIEENELQEALAWNYQKFSRRTLRFLIFLFRNSQESFSRIGPKEFVDIWSCLGQWRSIFERFDRDRSGKIDATELRDALYSLGYALPPSVLQVLISKYDDGSGRKVELSFDSFVECGMIVKGLTEKFKEKDLRYTGSATLSYDTFMSIIIPFLVSD
ncbi:Probable calcium-binding protein CML48 [Striga hermonthica]|uniref:Probable calcium-binding protein CML48 n=1 Tax=Striga hermonthica TaxID=68872 RepID=A0A9N7MR31_STRHE|nr:Probable calcium-binding protein CML48 [Striga hermonthica]